MTLKHAWSLKLTKKKTLYRLSQQFTKTNYKLQLLAFECVSVVFAILDYLLLFLFRFEKTCLIPINNDNFYPVKKCMLFRVINRDTRTTVSILPVSFLLTFSISNTGFNCSSCRLCTSVCILPSFCLYSFVMVSLLLFSNKFHAWIYFSCYQPWTSLLARMSWIKQTIKRFSL